MPGKRQKKDKASNGSSNNSKTPAKRRSRKALPPTVAANLMMPPTGMMMPGFPAAPAPPFPMPPGAAAAAAAMPPPEQTQTQGPSMEDMIAQEVAKTLQQQSDDNRDNNNNVTNSESDDDQDTGSDNNNNNNNNNNNSGNNKKERKYNYTYGNQRQLEGALHLLYPERAYDTLQKYQQGTLQYQSVGPHKNQSVSFREASHAVDMILYCASGGKAEVAASILRSLLRLPHYDLVKSFLVEADVHSSVHKEEREAKYQRELHAETDRIIVLGLKDFLYGHKTVRRRFKHEQDAVDAVLTAACSVDKRPSLVRWTRVIKSKRNAPILPPPAFTKKGKGKTKNNTKNDDNETEKGSDNEEDDTATNKDTNGNEQQQQSQQDPGKRKYVRRDVITDERFPLKEVAKRLGRTVEQMRPFRYEMAGRYFQPRDLKSKEDYYKANPIAACIVEFCHSDEASTVVTQNENALYAFKDVSHPATKEREEHRVRLWIEPTMERRHAAFLRSTAYADLLTRQQQDGALDVSVEIDLPTFKKYACKCVLNTHPKGKERDQKVQRKRTIILPGDEEEEEDEEENDTNNNEFVANAARTSMVAATLGTAAMNGYENYLADPPSVVGNNRGLAAAAAAAARLEPPWNRYR